MDAPRIQYATTSDGVSIACWSVGEGVPLVNPPPALPWSHVELEWQIPEWRHWYEHLAQTFQVIRYDNRGSGLSSGDIAAGDDIMRDHILDLQAVVDHFGLADFALLGLYGNTPIPITYATQFPDRVSHLILWCALARPGDTDSEHSAHQAFDQLRESDYEAYTEILAHTVFGWSEGAAAHKLAAYMRSSLSQDDARRCWDVSRKLDVTALLPQITQPTLVLHRRDFPLLPVDTSRRIASAIPGARFRTVSGASLSPYIGDMQETLDAINDFVGAERTTSRTAAHPHPAGQAAPAGVLRTIMFTDMEGSTQFTQQLGDARAQELVRLHNSIVSEALSFYGGSQVKHTGDGIMASFTTASGAVDCAIAIQRAFAGHADEHPTERVAVRIGLNAGEPVAEGDDLFGTAVQLARRVCDHGEPGQILLPEGVRHLVAGKGFLFADTGVAALKGFEDAVRLYEVRWREDGA